MRFYYLSQILQPWILPPRLNVMLAMTGYIISHFTKQIGNFLILLVVTIWWLFYTPVFAQFLIDTLQNRYQSLIVNRIEKNKASAIIILGGGSWVDKNAHYGYILSPATKDRLAYTAYLYNHTHFPILVSGGTADRAISPGAILLKKAMWDYFKVPIAWQENKSINTMDEALFTLPIIKENNIKTVYLITNAWHMPRSIYSFQHAYQDTKIQIIAAPMGYVTLQHKQGIINYIPSADGLLVSQTAIHEYMGMFGYFFALKAHK